jgi:hypothetical protein
MDTIFLPPFFPTVGVVVDQSMRPSDGSADHGGILLYNVLFHPFALTVTSSVNSSSVSTNAEKSI